MNGISESLDKQVPQEMNDADSDVEDEEIEGCSPQMEQELIWMRNILDIINRIPTMTKEEKSGLMPMINDHIAKNPTYKEEIERYADVLRKRNGGTMGHNITIPPSREIIRDLCSNGKPKRKKAPRAPKPELHVNNETEESECASTSLEKPKQLKENERVLQVESLKSLAETEETKAQTEKTKALVVDTVEPLPVEKPTAGLLMVSDKHEQQPVEDKSEVVAPPVTVKSPIKEVVDIKMEVDSVDEVPLPPPVVEEVVQEIHSAPEPEEPVEIKQPLPEIKVEKHLEPEPVHVTVVEPPVLPPVIKAPTPVPVKKVLSPPLSPPPPVSLQVKSPPIVQSPVTDSTPESTPKAGGEKEVPKRGRGRPRKIKEEPKEKVVKPATTITPGAPSVPVPPATPVASTVSATPSAPEPPSTSTKTTPTDVKEERTRRRSERARTTSIASTVSQAGMTTRVSARNKTEQEIKPEPMDVSLEVDNSTEATTSVEAVKVEADKSSDILLVADPQSAPVEVVEEEYFEIHEELVQRPVLQETEAPIMQTVSCQTLLSVRPALIAKGSQILNLKTQRSKGVEWPKNRTLGRAPMKHTQTDKVRISDTDTIVKSIHDPTIDEAVEYSDDDSDETDSRLIESRPRKPKEARASDTSHEGGADRIVTLIQKKNVRQARADITGTEMPSGSGITNPALLQRHMCISIMNSVAAQRCAAPFLHPVTERVAPGYREVVLNPVDINTLKKMVDTGKITKVSDLKKSIALMYANAVMYNYNNHEVNMHAKSEAADAFHHVEEILKLTSEEGTQGRRRPTTRAKNEVHVAASSSSRTTPVHTAIGQQLTPQAPVEYSSGHKGRRSIRKIRD